MLRNIKIPALGLGFSSLLAQVLIFRELIIVFYGNEIVYGLILGLWLLGIAVGSFLAGHRKFLRFDPKYSFIFFQIIFVFIFPLTIFVIRHLKFFLRISLGEAIGIIPMGMATAIVLAPLTIILGGIYTFLCRWAYQDISQGQKTAGTVYLWEALGSVVGGILLSLFLSYALPTLFTVFIVCLINIFFLLLLDFVQQIKRFFYILIGFLIVLIFFVSPMELATRNNQWKGYKVLISQDSIYGNIVLTKKNKEYSLYENGALSFTTHDTLSAENIVHYALLEHPHPKKILLIGNGLGGALKESLKYEDVTVDYVELDKKILDISYQYLPDDVVASLKDKRVKVIIDDARRYLKTTAKKYDVILVNLPNPSNIFINRYYTLDFFKEARAQLYPKGILALSVSSPENYLNEEARNLLRSVFSTLKNAFSSVIVISGEENIFLASDYHNKESFSPQRIISRLEERQIQTHYVHPSYIPFILNAKRQEYMEDVLKKEGMINTDIRPVAYVDDIVLWSQHFNSRFKNFLGIFRRISLKGIIIFFAVFSFLGIVFWRKKNIAVSVSIFATGFCEIVFQMIVLIAFQTLYGYVYYAVGIIMTAFMLGLIAGSWTAKKILTRSFNSFPYYLWTQIAVCCYSLLLPLVFILFRDAVFIQKYPFIFASVFLSLPILSGFIGGVQYPLAAQILSSAQKKISLSSSERVLYAIDSLGASLGALLVAMILIPVLGIAQVALTCGILSFFVLIWLVVSR